jgi:hypothetical protein
MTLSIPALAGDTGSQRATDRYQPPGPVMSARERRTITLFDLMMVVAATAIGLSLAQFGWQRKIAGGWISTWPVSAKYSVGGYPSTRWVVPIAGRVGPFLPCLVAWTGAFLVIRLRSPRPRRRRLLRQPGLVAAVVALSILTIEWTLFFGSAKLDGRFNWSSAESINVFFANGQILLAHHAGWAVVASWLTLVLIGQWHPERSWVDRGGRILGCTWIIGGPAASILIDHSAWWGYFFGS